jgi:hypothetical protein
MNIGWPALSITWTRVVRPCGQVSGGPRGVRSQSSPRRSKPASPPPGNAPGLGGCAPGLTGGSFRSHADERSGSIRIDPRSPSCWTARERHDTWHVHELRDPLGLRWTWIGHAERQCKSEATVPFDGATRRRINEEAHGFQSTDKPARGNGSEFLGAELRIRVGASLHRAQMRQAGLAATPPSR